MEAFLSQEIISRTLVNYDLMLFPTRYYTEGLPGTIIDAYIANLPVIATEWKHAREFIKDGETGFIVRFDNCQKNLTQESWNYITIERNFQ